MPYRPNESPLEIKRAVAYTSNLREWQVSPPLAFPIDVYKNASPGDYFVNATIKQISDAILAQVNAGIQREAASRIRGPRTALAICYIYGYDLEMIETVGPSILGLVVFFTFITAAISFLRERVQATLEKFIVSPLSGVETVSGYTPLGSASSLPSSLPPL